MDCFKVEKCQTSSSLTFLLEIIKQKICQNDPELFSSWKPISFKNGTKFQHQKLITSMPRRLQSVLKWRGDYTMVNNMPPSQLFWVAGIKFEMSSFCAYHSKMYLFKHLCYLCSIMNIILAHVILNYFNFILFKFKKCPNISGIRVVIICYKKNNKTFEW